MPARLAAALVIAVLATACAWFAPNLRLIRLLHLKTGDAHVLASPSYPPKDIVLLVVDQATLDRFPEPLMFWHGYYAEAIETAAAHGARVFGLDIVFPIPVERWVPGLDRRLADAVVSTSRTMPVICVTPPALLGRQRDWPVPLNMAATALGQVADATLHAGEDDFIRSIDLRSPEGLPSLALALAERAGASWPHPATRDIHIRYAGPAGIVPRVSLDAFIAAARAGQREKLRHWVEGKVVLLGADLLSDRHATPYYAFRPGQPANTAGVEIHANAVDTLLRGSALTRVPDSARFAALALAALAAALAGTLTGGATSLLWALAIAIACAASGQLLYAAGWLLPASEPLLAAALAWPAGVVWSRSRAARGRKRLQQAVNVYASPDVARVAEETGTVRLPARRIRATILFTDIANFTKFSETASPEQVLETLSDYFQRSSDAVREEGGQVVQLIGDGMLALFPDSPAALDHPARAIRAAQRILGSRNGLQSRAGIHTGEVVVGGVGSGDKMEYTALGDAVNVAARLEALNKQCGTRLLLSEATRAALGQGIETAPVGSFVLKGKAEPMDVHTVRESV